MKFRMGELFSGPGGLALGACMAEIKKGNEHFAIEHVWANDIDKDSCETFTLNICPRNPESVYLCPVDDLDITKLPPIDAFAYGFPCNDFSIVGEQNGFSGKFGPLYTYGLKVLNVHNPVWFLAENVGGLESANGGLAFKKIMNDLSGAGMGYTLTPHLYKFEEYGVPQTRHRIIIIGIRNDQNVKFRVPSPTTPDPKDYMTAYEAIEGRNGLNPIMPNAFNNEYTGNSALVIERLKHIPEGQNAWYEGIPEDLRLNVKGTKISQIYKRLDRNKPSYTITGSGGGGTHGYHWTEPRALTNRERARIQTFPDDFRFIGSKESVRKQIGMAVPPMGIKIIFEAILKTFAEVDYPSVPSRWA